MKSIAILISNKSKGTNLQAIIDAVEAGQIKGKITVVVSDTNDAYGLKRAKKHQLEIVICPKKENLPQILNKYNPDFIVLAGWKQIILDKIINSYQNRILNLHPGLIPNEMNGIVIAPDGTKALWNRGKFGQKAVQNFLNKKSTFAGSTTHFLSKEFDFGPVLERGFVEIKNDDTVDSLYERLKKVEHKIYIKSLQTLCNRA